MSCDTLVTPRASAVVPVSAHARCDTDRVSSAEFARDTRQTNVEIISLRLFNQADAAGGVTADDATGAVACTVWETAVDYPDRWCRGSVMSLSPALAGGVSHTP